MPFIKSRFIKSEDKAPALKPSAVIYEVNLSVDVDVIERFDAWLHQHTEEMLAIPGFISAATSVPDVDDESKKHRVVQYRLSDEAALAHYLEHDAENMRAKAQDQFAGHFTANRRVLSIAEAALSEQAMCANCGSELTGRFCNVCGQREEPRVPSMMSVAKEASNAFFGLESKLWRSIAVLLLKPGQLTLAYLEGKRQRYTSPLRLYLLFSIATFAYIALLNNQDIINIENDAGLDPVAQLTQNASDENSDEKPPTKTQELQDEEEDSFTLNLGFFSDATQARITQRFKRVGKKIEQDIKAGNTDAVITHFLQPLPKALLLFLPFIALAFKILYFGSGKYYIEHLIYLLHNHAFLFSALLLTVILAQIAGSTPALDRFIALGVCMVFSAYLLNYFYASVRKKFSHSRVKAVMQSFVIISLLALLFKLSLKEGIGISFTLLWAFYAPYYMYRSMRVVYQYSRWVTLASYLIIALVYVVMFIIMLTLSAAIAGYTYS